MSHTMLRPTSTKTSPALRSQNTSQHTVSPTTSSSSTRRKANDGDSDDEEEDLMKPPELSALARTMFDTEAKAPMTTRKSPSSAGSGGSRTGVEARIQGRKMASPSGEMFTPAPGRYTRKPYTGMYSATRLSDGSSAGGSTEGRSILEHVIHETPAQNTMAQTGSVIRPMGSYLRTRPNTATRRPIRLGMPIRRRDMDGGNDISSPDELVENPLDEKLDISMEKERHHEAQHEDMMDLDQSLQKSPSMPQLRRPSPQVGENGSPEPAALRVPSSQPSRQPSPFSSMEMDEGKSSRGSSAEAKPILRYNLPPPLPVSDKENIQLPSTFKRPASAAMGILQSSFASKPTTIEPSPLAKSTSMPDIPSNTPMRTALADRDVNTPHRPAPPPPPKMSMLDTATTQAGSAATATRKKRQHVLVNGRQYLRLDQIGRGGSAKVYRVMAENFKMLAMKKVSLDKQDEASIRGFKGEIDLLMKLQNVERVVRLFDYEVNDEKETLTVLLEYGELDFNRLMNSKYNTDDATLDISFIRHYWKEMLECVAAVHSKNIVHSDLKPANFVLVQGRLKLIDFGIANAIQDDTVNVHREQQVGTISYMAPEAIVDFNSTNRKAAVAAAAASGSGAAGTPLPRLHKLGAPSDVWSLGCILYQMTYGRTPFATLSNMYVKMQAIPDPKHIIDYPSTGIGGAPVPRSIIDTMKACLERDKDVRATIAELLSEQDPFLNPEREKEGVVDVAEETLVSLLENACEYTRDKGPPTEDHVRLWARDVFGKLKRKMAERRVRR